jgi:hypothetical protein
VAAAERRIDRLKAQLGERSPGDPQGDAGEPARAELTPENHLRLN